MRIRQIVPERVLAGFASAVKGLSPDEGPVGIATPKTLLWVGLQPDRRWEESD